MSRQSPPDVARPYLERPAAQGSERAIIRLHTWLTENELSLVTLTAEDLRRFAIERFRNQSGGGYYYRRVLSDYLLWLRRIGLLNFDPSDAGYGAIRLRKPVRQLPPCARGYLSRVGCESAAPYLLRFHAWLDTKHIAITAVTAAEVQRFFEQPFRKVLVPRHARPYRRALSGYLVWLYDGGRLQFDPAEIGLGRKLRGAPLPDSAAAFIRTRATTLRASSCARHGSSLRQFHDWLLDSRLRLRRLTRSDIEQWLMFLSDRKLLPGTRVHLILAVRAYLRWLAERGELNADPDLLIRASDLPRLPQFLPRPLPPLLDRELQRRLLESADPLWRGLCLMRQTGLRIGELLALEEDCVRVDPFGNRFLKVPLGKLDKERLVPLNESTFALYSSIKAALPSPRARLLQTADGQPIQYHRVKQALSVATDGLADSKPITSHRLRHTYATELLGAGMSLVGIMKLLGHHSMHMTLRYAAVTQEQTGREYFAAMEKIGQRYVAPSSNRQTDRCFDPIKAITDVIAWIHNDLAHESDSHQRSVRRLSKRLVRLQSEIRTLLDGKTSGKVAG